MWILNIITHISNITLYLKGSQCKRIRKGEIDENLGERATRRAAELKALVKGERVISVRPK